MDTHIFKNIFQKERIKNWILIFAAYTAFFYSSFIFGSAVLIGRTSDFVQYLRLLAGCIVLAILICAFGFFKAKYVFLLTSAGALAGIIQMLWIFGAGNNSGWEDLAGFAGFLVLFAGGFASGVIAQIAYIVHKRIKN